MYTIYSRDNCGYCVRAKTLLKNKGIEYEELDVADHREALLERVAAGGHPQPRTVPQIFKDEEYIGGYTELAQSFL